MDGSVVRLPYLCCNAFGQPTRWGVDGTDVTCLIPSTVMYSCHSRMDRLDGYLCVQGFASMAHFSIMRKITYSSSLCLSGRTHDMLSFLSMQIFCMRFHQSIQFYAPESRQRLMDHRPGLCCVARYPLRAMLCDELGLFVLGEILGNVGSLAADDDGLACLGGYGSYGHSPRQQGQAACLTLFVKLPPTPEQPPPLPPPPPVHRTYSM